MQISSTTRAARNCFTRRVGLAVLMLTVATTAGCSSNSPDAGKTSAKPSTSTSSANQPDLLSVPTINLTTGLKPEGLRGGQVNPLPGETIWFTGYGRVAPGALGTAVIAGHVADGKKPDIFANLIKVKQGSTFDLTMADGSTQKFSVKRAQVVGKQVLRHDQEVWGANTSTARVVLITCDDELGFGADGHRKANYVVVGERIH